MARLSPRAIFDIAIYLALAVAIASCASGDGGLTDASTRRMDAAGGREAGAGDAARTSADSGSTGPDAGGRDAGAPCGGVACEPFQYCDRGMCRDYPACRGDGTCDRPGDVCHSRRCVPGDVDVDGDGAPASEDCDESDPERYPGHPEECNLADDDCDDNVDEGDPAAICESYPGGGICIEGSCGCPPGTFDLDRAISGCKCVAQQPITEGLDCENAINLGDFADSGSMMEINGNVMPDDRETWYRFRAVDAADTSCDNFHVRVQLTGNPGGTFELTAFRGSCASAQCGDVGFTDFSWATDFRATVDGRLSGQCPCWSPPGAASNNVSRCEDDTSEFFVRVRRRAGSTLSCMPYTMQVTNGVYDSP